MDFINAGIQQYYDISQRVVETIQQVLEMDITLMNNSLKRIAGTGKYKELVNLSFEENPIFEHCLRTGMSQITITNDISNHICNSCPKYETCEVKATICVPIIQESKITGVLGAVAFSTEQLKRIIRYKASYLNILGKMSGLLQNDFPEYQFNTQKNVEADRLKYVMNIIDVGILVLDNIGNICYKNNVLVEMMHKNGINFEDSFIKDLWRNTSFKKFLTERTAGSFEITVEYNCEKYTLNAALSNHETSSLSNEIILIIKNINRNNIKFIEKGQDKLQFSDILGVSDNFLEAKRLAVKASETSSSVLIYGESGTGKELFAQAIHNNSVRVNNNFVPINCGAIPEDLLESELFGYEKGAFTGAYSNKAGKFEAADNGTIFLDEISEMPFHLQVKLLRVLQEKEVCRVGSNRIQKVNVKIIAATNNDLLKLVNEGLFRKDLYYRLNVIPLHIPPLRERREDIVYLSNYFVQYFAKMMNKDINSLSDEVMDLFLDYPWPGNVRELQSVVEYAVNFETGKVVSKDLIQSRLRLDYRTDYNTNRLNKNNLDTAVKQTKKEIFIRTIGKYRYSDTKEQSIQSVCRELNISRATFYRKIKELGIDLNNEISIKNDM